MHFIHFDSLYLALVLSFTQIFTRYTSSRPNQSFAALYINSIVVIMVGKLFIVTSLGRAQALFCDKNPLREIRRRHESIQTGQVVSKRTSCPSPSLLMVFVLFMVRDKIKDKGHGVCNWGGDVTTERKPLELFYLTDPVLIDINSEGILSGVMGIGHAHYVVMWEMSKT
jgi:hypothetical protein